MYMHMSGLMVTGMTQHCQVTWAIKQLLHYIHGTVKNLLVKFNCVANGVHSVCVGGSNTNSITLP